MNLQSYLQGSIDVPQNLLDSIPMNISWLGEKLTHLVYSKGNVWTGESQIL
jgi:hypothetical protein